MFSPPPNGGYDGNDAPVDDYPDITGPRRQQALGRARNWFVTLVVAGLVLGIVVAFGVVQLLNVLGLTEKPDEPLRLQLEQNSQPQN